MINPLASLCALLGSRRYRSARPFTGDFQDLRNYNGTGVNYITSVKNQDDPVKCNACTAFAVVATVEGTYNKQHPATPISDLTAMKLFREAGPVDQCTTSHWWPNGALEWCRHTGLEKTAFPLDPRVQIFRYEDLLGMNVSQTKTKMKDWINNNGPVAAVMVQYEDFPKWGQYWTDHNAPGTPNPNVYSPGEPLPGLPGQPVDRGPIVGGHVVSIVGYDDRPTGQDPKFWICKNSWGDKWNGDGYVRIAQGKPGGHGHEGIGGCYIEFINVWGVSFFA